MVSDSYFGKPFVWCLLHNGGGNRAIYGNLTLIANEPINTMNIPNITMVNHYPQRSSYSKINVLLLGGNWNLTWSHWTQPDSIWAHVRDGLAKRQIWSGWVGTTLFRTQVRDDQSGTNVLVFGSFSSLQDMAFQIQSLQSHGNCFMKRFTKQTH